MTVDKDKLSRRVKQSTQPGPWKAVRNPTNGEWRVVDANGFWVCDVGEDPHQAKYIAEAHPQAVEAVLAELAQLGTQLDARIAWQVQAVAHMQTWRALFDAAVAMREGHEGCVTEPACGKCFRCKFDRAVDEAMTAVAAGSEKFIEDSTLAGQLADWLDSKARYFIHNRNLGPYSAELAKQIRDGSWREDDEVLPPFGPGAECSLCHQDHSQSDEEQG